MSAFDVVARKQDLDFFRVLNNLRRTERPLEKISEFAESNRILPTNTPFPGFWSNDKTPYTIEPMDNMAPSSVVVHQATMKGAQLGMTAAMENCIGYYMKEFPVEQLYISGTEELLRNWSGKRLDPLIDSIEMRDKIFRQSSGKQSAKTGDRTFSKEYIGGTLNMSSAQAPSGLRMDSKRCLWRDEIDSAPLQLRTGEGNWLSVSYARTNAYGNRKKIWDNSTPTVEGLSPIETEYLNGDCRKFFVPCPFCGEHQILEWTSEDDVHGLKAEMDSGYISRVYYVCKHCKSRMENHHKTVMLLNGQWRATARAINPNRRSYQLSSLYSPVGMLDWRELYEKYLEAQRDEEDGMRSFTNLYLGKPFKEIGARPKIDNVIELRSGYRSETVPEGVLFITAGIDVQKGSKKNPKNPPRLEMEICGHGARYRTWSICYRRFEGEVDDPNAGAWEMLKEYMEKNEYGFKRRDGRKFNVEYILIDSGYNTHVVYDFCAGWNGTHPSKGYGVLKKRKAEKGDEVGPLDFKKYRKVKVSEDTILHEISTNFYKTTVYRNLVKVRKDEGLQPAGLCEFPTDYKDSYFKMLTAEEKWRDGSFHCPQGRRNEALDVRVLNLCAGHAYLDSKLASLKKWYKDQGSTDAQIEMVNHKMVLGWIESKTKVAEKK